MLISAHQPNYLPYPGYFAKMMASDAFVLIERVQFEKQSWQNRNRILTSNGALMLTVPTFVKDKSTQKIDEVRIDNKTPWRRKHFQSIVLAYKKAPFFGLYGEFFEALYGREWEFLRDIDYEILEFFIKELGIKTPIFFDKDFELQGSKNDYLIGICKALRADAYLSNEGSAAYVDVARFNEAGVAHYFCRYRGDGALRGVGKICGTLKNERQAARREFGERIQGVVGRDRKSVV